MKFFEYKQNNSGGSFDKEMGYCLWVEANSAAEADARAQSVGVYFDGCSDGRDCSCCGDRWHSAYGKGEKLPTINEYSASWDLDNTILLAGRSKLQKLTPKLIASLSKSRAKP